MQSAAKGDGGNVSGSGPAAPLTANNLAQHTDVYVRPPPTPDERLLQAKNFLSDNDVLLFSKFREHHWEIECLLRTLSDDKVPCDSVLFRQVQDMLRVHKVRIDQLDHPVAEQVDPQLLAPYSTRLPTQDPAGIEATQYALRKEDHAPFTIDRKPDHAQFVRAFRSHDKAGQSLREVERGAYFQMLKTPSLIGEDLNDATYEERAFKRGRLRAALQLALRAIGGNEEQNFAGDWMERIVSLPQPPTTKAEEPRMCQGLSESERPAEPDRFAWTKGNIGLQHGQKQLVTWVNDERAQTRPSLQGTDGVPLAPATEPVKLGKPSQKQSIVAYRRERRIARLVQVAFGVVARVSYDHIQAMEDTQAPISPEARVIIGAYTQGLINREANNTRDIPTATQIELLQHYVKAGGQLLQNKSDGDVVNSPLDNAQLDRLEACSVKSLSRPDEDTRVLLRTLRVELLDLIHTVHSGNPTDYSAEDRKRDREALKNFREDLLGESPAERAEAQFLSLEGVVLGDDQARSLVTDRILKENNEDLRDRRLDHSKIWSFSSTLSEISKAQNYFSMEKWPTPSRSVPNTQTAAQTAAGKRKATEVLDTTTAAKRLRNEYSTQATGGKRKASTDPETAPSPKRSAYAVDYKSLDPTDPRPSRRLDPEEIGFNVVREKSHETVPRTGAGGLIPPEIKDFDVKMHGQDLENAPDPREKRLKGEAIFPFGETSTTSLAMNNQIQYETRRGKRVLFSSQAPSTSNEMLISKAVQGASTSTALVLRRPQARKRTAQVPILPLPPRVGFTLPVPPPQLKIGQLKQAGEPGSLPDLAASL